MYAVRLITLIILLFSASFNTIVFAGLTYDNESLNTSKFIVIIRNFFFESVDLVFYVLEIRIDFFSFVGKEIGVAIWDQKVVKNVRGAVKPSISRPARQRSSPWSGSENSNSTQWESYVAIIEAFGIFFR